MFSADDRITVVETNRDDVATGAQATVVAVEGDFVVALVDDFVPTALDKVMAEVLGYPIGAIPFKSDQVEVVNA